MRVLGSERSWVCGSLISGLILCLITGCSAADPAAGEGGNGPATTTSADGGGGGDDPLTGGGGAGAAGGGSAGAPPNVDPLDDVGTLVVLGDSIGDGGGQAPFYYALLRDALDAHYAHAVAYERRAESGSETGALLGQIGGLPSALPGPVAVAITSGGNDMKDNLVAILTGSDGPARTAMGDNISEALEALLVPDRFGAGVAVHVYFANIYDASDGEGNFGSSGCNVQINSPSPTDPFFASWNGEIGGRVIAVGQVLADMHQHFAGHGFNHPPSWYASDCTHPNSTGHAELAGLFGSLITEGT